MSAWGVDHGVEKAFSGSDALDLGVRMSRKSADLWDRGTKTRNLSLIDRSAALQDAHPRATAVANARGDRVRTPQRGRRYRNPPPKVNNASNDYARKVAQKTERYNTRVRQNAKYGKKISPMRVRGPVEKAWKSDEPKVSRKGLQPVYAVSRDRGKPTQLDFMSPSSQVSAHDTGKKTLFRRRPKLKLAAGGPPSNFDKKRDTITGGFAVKGKFTQAAANKAVAEYKQRKKS